MEKQSRFSDLVRMLGALLFMAALTTGARAETLVFSGTNVSTWDMHGQPLPSTGDDLVARPDTGELIIVPGSIITYRYTDLQSFGPSSTFTWEMYDSTMVDFPKGDGEVQVTLSANGGYHTQLTSLAPEGPDSPTFGTLEIYVTNPDTTGPVLQSISMTAEPWGCTAMQLHFDELIGSGGFFPYQADNLRITVDGVDQTIEGFGPDTLEPTVFINIMLPTSGDITVSYTHGGDNKMLDNAVNEAAEFEISGTCSADGVFWDGSGPLIPVDDTSDDTSDDNSSGDAEPDTGNDDTSTQGETGADTASVTQKVETVVKTDVEAHLQVNLASRRSLVSAARTRLERGGALDVTQARWLDIMGNLTGSDRGTNGSGRLDFRDRLGALDIYVQGDLRYTSGGGRTNGAANILAIIEKRTNADQLVGLSFGAGLVRGSSDGALAASTRSTSLSVGAHGVQRSGDDTIVDGFAMLGREKMHVSLTDSSNTYEADVSVWSVGLGGSVSHDATIGTLALRHVASFDLGISRHPDLTLTAGSGATIDISADRVQVVTFRYAPEIALPLSGDVAKLEVKPSVNCQIVSGNSGSDTSCGYGAGLRLEAGDPAEIRLIGTASYERLNGSNIGSFGLNLEHRF